VRQCRDVGEVDVAHTSEHKVRLVQAWMCTDDGRDAGADGGVRREPLQRCGYFGFWVGLCGGVRGWRSVGGCWEDVESTQD